MSKGTTSADETDVYIVLGGVCNKVSCDVTVAVTDSVGRGPKRTERTENIIDEVDSTQEATEAIDTQLEEWDLDII